jgi:pyruvate dehydrogenase (quinone)
LVNLLACCGIWRIFGCSGDDINVIMGALNKATSRLAFVQVRYEKMAALMACDQAKFTGEVGVCLAISDLGATNLLNGFYDAKLNNRELNFVTCEQRLRQGNPRFAE